MPGPNGRKIDDGFATYYTFSNNTTLALWEKEVTPPGVEGGEPVDTTTMRNIELITKAPQKLKEITQSSMMCAYDEAALLAIMSMVNQNQQVTITFPDGRPWTFYGYLRSFKPNRIVRGQQPTAEVIVEPTMQNNSGVETGFTVGTSTSSTTTTTTTS